MALNYNELIIVGHAAAKPFIMKGLEAGLAAIDKKVNETGTIADNLLWADIKGSVREHKDLNPI